MYNSPTPHRADGMMIQNPMDPVHMQYLTPARIPPSYSEAAIGEFYAPGPDGMLMTMPKGGYGARHPGDYNLMNTGAPRAAINIDDTIKAEILRRMRLR